MPIFFEEPSAYSGFSAARARYVEKNRDELRRYVGMLHEYASTKDEFLKLKLEKLRMALTSQVEIPQYKRAVGVDVINAIERDFLLSTITSNGSVAVKK